MNYNLFIWEDHKVENFYPLVYLRPICGLRAGTRSIFDRIKWFYKESFFTILCRDEIAELTEFKFKTRVNKLTVDPNLPSIFVNGRAIIDKRFVELVEATKSTTLFVHENIPVALLWMENETAELERFFSPILTSEGTDELLRGYPVVEVGVKVFDGIWEIVETNSELVNNDFEEFEFGESKGVVGDRAVLYNPERIWVGDGARIDDLVVLDARQGAIIVESGAYIQAGSVIVGPAYIGKNTHIYGGKIRGGCSFGPYCRLGGEIESSIFLGYSNKYHDGFIGHSYIGEWVNIGALTTTSDLKNNYSPVRVSLNGKDIVQTGLLKLGSFIGDHSKLGIGTLLNAGTVIGVSTSFFGGGLAPKFIPSFAWGDNKNLVEYELEKALETARTVYSRRGLEFSFAEESSLRRVFELTSELRSSFLSKNETEPQNELPLF